MLKIKKNQGITLISLAVTIAVLLLLITVTLNIGTKSVRESEDKLKLAELDIVQQAVLQQYSKAKTAEQLGILATETDKKPHFFVGSRIENTNAILQPIKDLLVIKEGQKYYEDYFYQLSTSDLKTLGITDSEDTYIVNYQTGEVYNATKKTTSDGTILYQKALIALPETQTIDNTFAQ